MTVQDDGLDLVAGAREWTHVGTAGSSEYYSPEPGVLVVMPVAGMVDDEASARANTAFQHSFFRKNGRSGAVLIFFDRVSSQDRGARQVYSELSDPALQTCVAMIGGTALGRAMISFFMGLTKPRVPIRLFKDYDGAVEWARQMNRDLGAPVEV